MNVSWRNGSIAYALRSRIMKLGWKLLVWTVLVILLILAVVGLIVFKDVMPRKPAIHFSFAGWTNVSQGGLSAVLSVSNQSPAPVMYLADGKRQPRCDVTKVMSRQKQGDDEHIVYSNLTMNVWTGYLWLQLPAQAEVRCVLPWRDEYTNGHITFSYIPHSSFVERLYETLTIALLGSSMGGETVPLTGAPWTNAFNDWYRP